MKSIYLIESNTPVVAMVDMEKPLRCASSRCCYCDKLMEDYKANLAAATRHEVIGKIPDSWVVGEEVIGKIQHQISLFREDNFYDCQETDYDTRYPTSQKRIVFKPLPLDQPDNPNDCSFPNCGCDPIDCVKECKFKPLPVGEEKTICELCGNTGLMLTGYRYLPCEKCSPVKQETEIDMVSIDFVLWYSGMDKIKILNAYSRWVKETIGN